MADTKNDVLLIHAFTPLHPGSGASLGTVDLPVQRERHTQWPVISGSAIKGILRDECRERVSMKKYADDPESVPIEKRKTKRQKANVDKELEAVFGPEKVEGDSSHAGAINITDARILAFPVRSLSGVFAWVTCPAVLERLNRDLKLAGKAPVGSIPSPKRNQASLAENSPLLMEGGNSIVLEEFDFTRNGEAGKVASWMAGNAVDDGDALTKKRMETHLAVLHDDDFTHFVRYATEVSARVGLDYERKTAKEGALFYQEFLPPETLFYSLVMASDSRKKGTPKTADKVLEFVRDNIPSVIQIGGDETIGKGLCAVRFMNGKEARP